MARHGRFILLLLFSLFVLASCGGSDEASPATSTTSVAASVEDGAAVATSTTSADPVVEETTTTAATTDEPASGLGQAELVFEDGRSWTLDGVCVHTPDNTGAAAALWRVEVEAADGASFIAIKAFPFDPEDTTPFLTGSFVDADDNVFVVIEAEDVSDGSNLILTLGMHDGVKTIDDPVDFTATVTCGV